MDSYAERGVRQWTTVERKGAPVRTVLIASVCLLVGLSSCARASGEGAAGPPAQLTITCYAAYRASVIVSIEEQVEVVLGPLDSDERLEFDDLTLRLEYRAGEQPPGERSLLLTVEASGQELTRQLYQLAAAPRNEFAGGHGFTGLSYVYHPATGAELQYWCINSNG